MRMARATQNVTRGSIFQWVDSPMPEYGSTSQDSLKQQTEKERKCFRNEIEEWLVKKGWVYYNGYMGLGVNSGQGKEHGSEKRHRQSNTGTEVLRDQQERLERGDAPYHARPTCGSIKQSRATCWCVNAYAFRQ